MKGKEVRVLVEYGDGTDDMYSKKHIETLRQKLIEDKNDLQNKITTHVASYISSLYLINKFKQMGFVEIEQQLIREICSIINSKFREYENQINKRFGAEDEQDGKN